MAVSAAIAHYDVATRSPRLKRDKGPWVERACEKKARMLCVYPGHLLRLGELSSLSVAVEIPQASQGKLDSVSLLNDVEPLFP